MLSTSSADNKAAAILLVEDAPDDVFLFIRAFKLAGIENRIMVAHNGEEAVQVLTSDDEHAGPPPCLVITDIKMPKVDGFGVLSWFLEQDRFRSVPKIVVSSSVLEKDVTKSLRLGASAYFVKPNSSAELLELVRGWKRTYLEKAPCP
jgi:CheY-like chemotaxis protein